ncbi:MAG: RDD family protein [Pyrinomonadaceae bacterium]
MSSSAVIARKKVVETKEKIVGFSPESVKAPFVLRCAGIFIDYLVMAIVPVFFLVLARYLGEDGSTLLNGDMNNFGWLLAIMIGFANLIILPAILGQSIGKMFVGTRIVRRDGSEALFRQILLRQTLGYLVSILTFGIGFLIALIGRRGAALHDLISGTIVIQANKQRLS